jgi:hypothetical protein
MILTVEQIERIHAWTPDAAEAIDISPSEAGHGTVTATYRTSTLVTGRVIVKVDITRDGTPYELGPTEPARRP